MNNVVSEPADSHEFIPLGTDDVASAVLDVCGCEVQAEELIQELSPERREELQPIIVSFFDRMNDVTIGFADELMCCVAEIAGTCGHAHIQELYQELHTGGILGFRSMWPVLEYILEAALYGHCNYLFSVLKHPRGSCTSSLTVGFSW